MSYLLDVNVLIAIAWPDHDHHRAAMDWIQDEIAAGSLVATTPIVELGFVRVSVLRSVQTVSLEDAQRSFKSLLKMMGPRHRFLADDVRGSDLPAWCRRSGDTTDGHLCQLAAKHGLRLATLDQGIPDGYVIA